MTDDRQKFPHELPAGFSAWKRRGQGRRARWKVSFRLGGERHTESVYPDASATLHWVQKLAPMGVIDPRLARHMLQERRPLTRHLADYRQVLLDRGNTVKHADQVHDRAARIFAAYHADRLSAIIPSQTLSAIAGLHDARFGKRKPVEGDIPPVPAAVSLQTRNHFLRAVKQFTAWLGPDDDKRMAEDPLKGLSGWNVKIDRRHDRQDLGESGLDYLFRAAASGGVVCGMSGKDRRELYRVAALSGLRPNELRTLTPRRCDLDAKHPVLIVPAGYSKHRREDHQPIPEWFVRELKKHLAGKSADEPIWKMPDEAVDLIIPDLEKARALWVEDARSEAEQRERAESDFLLYQDRDGRFADFYALRHTYVCGLVRMGLNPKECQLLARHASITTTMDYYAHLRLTDVARAASTIPNPSRTHGTAPAEVAKATGTYDQALDGAQRNRQRAGGVSWGLVGTTGGDDPNSIKEPMNDNPSKDNEQAEKSGSHLEGLEPSTFGSVDRRAEIVSADLAKVTGAGKKARSAIDSAQTPEEQAACLASAVEKINREFRKMLAKKGGVA